ncbi:HIT domain-containing protein [Thalassotalea ganghwensis]
MTTNFELDPLLQKDCIELLDLPLSKLLLMNDSQYPWFILVPRIADINEIYQLEWQEQQQLLNESSLLAEFLMQHYHGDKLNIGALGNICKQLHLHHVVRFQSDKAWPKPIWGVHAVEPYQTKQIEQIKKDIIPALKTILMQE